MNTPMLKLANPAAEPVVFEHNGQIYARTQDIAAYLGREHEGMVRSIERGITRQMIGQCVFEDHHQGNYGWTIRSYWLTETGFLMLWAYIAGGKSRQNFIAMTPYLEAFIAKEAELQAKPGVTAAPAGAENPSFMTLPPTWFSQTVKEVLCRATNTDDPVMQRHLMLAAIKDIVFQLAKVRDIHRDHNFIVHDLHRLMGLDYALMRKGLGLYSDPQGDLETSSDRD
jgi:hypothetical protein